MHIKKLEICGFKSFVDRTVIHFDHDMIGVVGPNGCGKSNIVDAIRWVMGEQSAKALRGKGMGDVVFCGSETRPQAGFAEVSITFDNSDPAMAQALPLEYRDYAEISVTRRIYRGDGANEYFINKIPVRLRDVTEVFLGTGVGRKAYSIVEQGKIGLIVSARAEDRRILIEEAAGITKYKARKRQAENKMNLTRTNLTRVTDIVSEIERQLGSLKRQAAKASRFVRYREELDDLLLWEASHRLLELVVTTSVADSALRTSEERVTAERGAVDVRDAEIEVMRQEATSREATAERTQNDAFLSDNDVREEQTRIERASDRYEHLDTRLRQARSEQDELAEKERMMAEEQRSLAEQLADVEGEQLLERERVEAEAQELEALKQRAESDDSELSFHRQQMTDAAAAIARGEAELAGFEQRAVEVEQRRVRLERELARLQGEHGGLRCKREEVDGTVNDLVNKKHAMCDARDALVTELPSLRTQLTASERTLDGDRDTLHGKRSRLCALQELSERMEGVGAGVRNLLKTGDASLRGLVADRIEVPAEYTAALASLIGDRLQCVIVDDMDRALELLRNLAEDRRGRATVIPTHIDPTAATTPAAFVNVEGVIGLVADQIVHAPEDTAVVRALVGDAVLVTTAAVAKLLHSHNLECDVVTLDGTVFHSDGRVTGGAGDALASGMLDSKREIRDLEGEVAELVVRMTESEASVDSLRERVTKLQQALDQAKSEAHEAEIAMVTGQQDLQRLDQKVSLVGRRCAEVSSEVEDVRGATDRGHAEHATTLAALLQGRELAKQAHAAASAAEELALNSRERLSVQQASYTERKVQLASVSERASACRGAMARLKRDYDELTVRIEALEVERAEGARESGTVAAEIFLAKSALLDAKLCARQAQQAFENARLGLDDARHALALREAELRELRAGLDELVQTQAEQQMCVQRLRLEREHLDEAIRERFRGLELTKVVGDFHARRQIGDEDRSLIQQLTKQIDRMGSVNLDAMQEFEEQSERFTYYTEQKSDLENALDDLETAIGQMNKESRRLFKYAFDGINRRFKEIFPKMFRGGKAELRLTNPDDTLETGIDIIAQPPGKRLGNLELMSGGEKAFTAVSLLLAIFRFKPSPFCILDEVDAPLDDANVDRYVEGIRAMTDRSQFIVITHSKRTMQAVDVLYGVTMQEAGVSKLVGVRVGDTQTRSARRRSEVEDKSAPPAAEPQNVEAAPIAVA